MTRLFEPAHLRGGFEFPAIEEEQVTVLTVSGSENDHASLQSILRTSGYVLRSARSWDEALAAVQAGGVQVLIFDSDSLDGSLQTFSLGALQPDGVPSVLVASRRADDALWAEAIDRGACDILPKPYSREEVSRAVFLAWVSWKRARQYASRKRSMGSF